MKSVTENKQFFCLDPNCFVSLARLQDTLNLLKVMKKSNTHVIIPSELYQTIMSEPNIKFTIQGKKIVVTAD